MSPNLARQLDYDAFTRRSGARAPEAPELEHFRIEVIDTRAGFDAIRAEWDALFESAALPWQVFQTHFWLSCWADHYLDGKSRLAIVVAWRGGKLAMAWPMVVVRQFGLTRLSWMGEPASQYGDALVEESDDTLELLLTGWNTLRSMRVDCIHLRKTRKDARVAPVLARAGLKPLASEEAPCLDFAGAATWKQVEQGYSAKLRSTRRRLARRLEELGGISFERVASGPAACALVVDAFEMKRGRFRKYGRIATTLADRRFQAMLAEVAMHPDARLSVVRRDGAPVGVEFSLACKGRVFGYLISHDSTFDKQGLGVLLAEFSIRSAHLERAAGYDFLAPSDAYKLDWANGAVGVTELGVGVTPRGRLYLRAWVGYGRQRAKQVLRAVPPSLGHAAAALLDRLRRTGVAR